MQHYIAQENKEKTWIRKQNLEVKSLFTTDINTKNRFIHNWCQYQKQATSINPNA